MQTGPTNLSSGWLDILTIPEGSSTCYSEPGSLTWDAKVVITGCFFLLFSVTFFVAWVLLYKYYSIFPGMSRGIKADNCSRINSTIHTAIIIPGLSVGLYQTKWDPDTMLPLSSVVTLQVCFCCTVAYFIADFIVIVYYKVPMWVGFAAHHAIAIIPPFVYMFVAECPYGVFVLSGFFFVEFSNFSLNTQAVLQQNGHGKSRAYAFAFYFTFISWIFIRLINPAAMLAILHMKVMPSLPDHAKWCIYPGTASAYLILLFCGTVFVTIMCKELRNRWAAEPGALDLADPDDTRAVKSPLSRRSKDGSWKADPAIQMAKAATNAVRHAAHMDEADEDIPLTENAPLVKK